MIKILDIGKKIALVINGITTVTVEKEGLVDFTVDSKGIGNTNIYFHNKDEEVTLSSIPDDSADDALRDLIRITDELGV